MDEQEYLSQYEHRLQDSLVSLCTAYEMMGGVLLENDDIESKFIEALAQPYLADAVREYRAYPEASVAWAGYLGMAVAKLWDADWQAFILPAPKLELSGNVWSGGGSVLYFTDETGFARCYLVTVGGDRAIMTTDIMKKVRIFSTRRKNDPVRQPMVRKMK